MALNGWIKIAPDGAVVLAIAARQMGQGIHTALYPMLLAEKMDIPMANC
ncbi:MAG: hypothetical protein U5M53_01590 [Rhodoferax sp.]|nr:hypothetical protein [Rhodoferax sp.]